LPAERRRIAVPARLAAGVAAGALAAAAIVVAPEAPDVPLFAALGVAVLVAALPRLGWLLAAAGGVAIAGEPALAAAMLAASPVLLPRDGLVWSVPAAAPLL